MVIQNFTDVEVVQNLVENVSSLTTFIQAIGGLILIYIIFNIISMILNRRKTREIKKINANLEDIKKLLKKKRN